MKKSSGSVSFRSSRKSSGKKKSPRHNTSGYSSDDRQRSSVNGDKEDSVKDYRFPGQPSMSNPYLEKHRTSGQYDSGQRQDGIRKPEKNSKSRRSGQRRSRRKSFGCTLPLIIVLLLLAFICLILHITFSRVGKHKLNQSSITVNNKDKNMKKYQNIALFGVDSQDNVIGDTGSRTDSIIVASINKWTKKVKLMSVYRDTYVSIDGNYDKINAAYAYGGPEQAINTINRNLDLNITDFATVNFKALADAVDVLGGITLTINSEKELQNLNDYIGNMNKINGGDSPKFDAVGTYTFDGNQAVAYSRIRYMEGGDHARASHQRLVVEGILHEAKKKPWKLNALISKVLPECKTSFSSSKLSRMALGLLLYDIEDSQAYPFDSFDERYNGIYYGFPTTVESNTIKAHEYLFGTKDYEPTDELKRISEKVKNISDIVNPY